METVSVGYMLADIVAIIGKYYCSNHGNML